MDTTFMSARTNVPDVVARVCAQDRDAYVVATASGAAQRAHLGRAFAYDGPDGTPVVGDFVVLAADDGTGLVPVERVLPRANLLARRAAGGRGDMQPIAANLDIAAVVVAANRDFNLRRIERYLVTAAACGIDAAIVVTKIDLAEEPERFAAAARSVAGRAGVYALSAHTGDGLDAFRALGGRGRTIALVGSSGVGKSSLVNALLGDARLATSAVRADDDRGRHTTVRRELVTLHDGTALIDTPGMRELGLADAAAGLATAFDDVAELAAACRFRDCKHDREPGCAVRDGLDPERLAAWNALRREAAFEARKTDRAAREAQQRRWKAIERENRRRRW